MVQDNIQSALSFSTPENRAAIERLRSGESVEIRKRSGVWPTFLKYTMRPELWSIKNPIRDEGMLTASTFPEAAAAWNGRGEG
jgi:hypothetical protein